MLDRRWVLAACNYASRVAPAAAKAAALAQDLEKVTADTVAMK